MVHLLHDETARTNVYFTLLSLHTHLDKQQDFQIMFMTMTKVDLVTTKQWEGAREKLSSK